MTGPGTYDGPLALFIDQPWTQPFPPLTAVAAITALALLCTAFGYVLYFKLIDTATGNPKSDLKDVRVLTFLSPGVWQRRDIAQSVGDGVYELKINVPETGFG